MKRLAAVLVTAVVTALFFSSPAFSKMPTYSKLCEILKENLSSYKMQKCTGANMTYGSYQTTMANTIVKINGGKITLTVASGNMLGSWSPMFTKNFSMETESAKVESKKIDGFNGGIMINKKEKNSGAVFVCLKPYRNVCVAAVLAEFSGVPVKTALSTVKRLDLERLAELFKDVKPPSQPMQPVPGMPPMAPPVGGYN